MIPAYVPFVFYTAGILCLLGSLYVAWELFRGIYDFVRQILLVRRQRKEIAEYTRQQRAMGHTVGLAAGQFNIMGQQQSEYREKARPVGVCSLNGPHQLCNGKPRGDCTNGR